MDNHNHNLFTCAIALIVMIIGIDPVIAQSGAGMMVGVECGDLLHTYSTDFTYVNLPPSAHYAYQNGSGAGQVSLGVRLSVPLLDTYRTSAIAELLYEDASGNFVTLDGSAISQYSYVSRSATLKYALLNAGVSYSPWADSLPSGIGVEGMISFGLPLAAKITITQYLTDSVTGAISSSAYEEPVENLNRIRLAMRVSLRYDLPFRQWGLVVSPAISYDSPFDRVSAADNWRMAGLLISLGASLHL